jgi:hypothetical protein
MTSAFKEQHRETGTQYTVSPKRSVLTEWCHQTIKKISFIYNNNNNIIYLTANRMSPGGSGYYACT